MSSYQDAIASAMGRRIQDSALKAATLLAQHNEWKQHTEDLQAEQSEYLAAQAFRKSQDKTHGIKSKGRRGARVRSRAMMFALGQVG